MNVEPCSRLKCLLAIKAVVCFVLDLIQQVLNEVLAIWRLIATLLTFKHFVSSMEVDNTFGPFTASCGGLVG
jgi:hypothetical protein